MTVGDDVAFNAGTGGNVFAMSLRISRMFSLGGAVKLEGLVEAFNLTNRTSNLTFNGNFGPGAYPTNPSSTFGQVLAVSDPRSVQLGVRLRF